MIGVEVLGSHARIGVVVGFVAGLPAPAGNNTVEGCLETRFVGCPYYWGDDYRDEHRQSVVSSLKF